MEKYLLEKVKVRLLVSLKKNYFNKARFLFSVFSISTLTFFFLYSTSLTKKIDSLTQFKNSHRGNPLFELHIQKQFPDNGAFEHETSIKDVIKILVNSKETASLFHLLLYTTSLSNVEQTEVKDYKIIVKSKGENCFHESCRELGCVIYERNKFSPDSSILLSSGFVCDRVQLPQSLLFIKSLTQENFILVDIKNLPELIGEDWEKGIDKSIISLKKETSPSIFIKQVLNLLQASKIFFLNIQLIEMNRFNKSSNKKLITTQKRIVLLFSAISIPLALLFLFLGQKKIIRLEAGLRSAFGSTKKRLYTLLITDTFIQSSFISLLGLFSGWLAFVVFSYMKYNIYLLTIDFQYLSFCFGVIVLNAIISIFITILLLNKNIVNLLRS